MRRSVSVFLVALCAFLIAPGLYSQMTNCSWSGGGSVVGPATCGSPGPTMDNEVRDCPCHWTYNQLVWINQGCMGGWRLTMGGTAVAGGSGGHPSMGMFFNLDFPCESNLELSAQCHCGSGAAMIFTTTMICTGPC